MKLPQYCAVVTKSGNLKFSETSGTLQACYGTALPFLQYETKGLRHYATNRQVAGSIPDGVIGIFQ